MEKEEKVGYEPIDGSIVVPEKDAKKILKEHGNLVSNGDVEAFVTLKDINKIYPNGIQAVYDFNIDIKEHDFIVLVGPSGCGKSTTLRMIAGLEDITSGYLYINKILSNYLPSKDRDISMVFQSYALYPQMTVYDNIAFPLRVRKYRKPKRNLTLIAWNEVLRAMENTHEIASAIVDAKDKNLNYTTRRGYVSTRLHISDKASEILLKYPIVNEASFDSILADGMTLREKVKNDAIVAIEQEKAHVREIGATLDEEYRYLDENGNLIYQEERLTSEEIRNKVFEAARILDLGPYLDRRPKELSGGQMQRVALGRAIVRNAKLFLMDEPLSNLDAKLRVQMRSEIVRIHEQIGATTIYVTHDQTEAMTMATKIAVMSKGWVQQIGEPQEIYSHPRNIFVATFIGSPAMNIVKATYKKGTLLLPNGYQIKLGKEFVETHDRFYKEKLADMERMLSLPDFKKMHALKILDEVFHTNAFFEMDHYEKDIRKLIDDLKSVPSSYTNQMVTLLMPYVTELKEELKRDIEYLKKVNNLKKMEEILEVARTIDDLHGQAACTILNAYIERANLDLNNSEPRTLETFLAYKNSIQKAIQLTKDNVDKGAESIIHLLTEIDGEKVLSKDIRNGWMPQVRRELLTFEKIASEDIGKLHNAQAFSEQEEKQEETLYYQKKKGKSKSKGIKVNLNSVNIAFINNLYDVALNLYHQFEQALTGEHPVKMGIRPEHIHLDEEYTNPKKTKAFTAQAGVVELMGSELLVHTPWNGADLIAKIATGTLVKPHTEIHLTFNGDKILVFDLGSGDTIR